MKWSVEATGNEVYRSDEWFLNHPSRWVFDNAVETASHPATYLSVAGSGAKLLPLVRRANDIPTPIWRHDTAPVPRGYKRVYRAVSLEEYEDIRRTGRLNPSPYGTEGKYFADSLDGAHLHGVGLEGSRKYHIITADVLEDAPSTEFFPNMDLRGPARYIHCDDLQGVSPLRVPVMHGG